MATNSNEILYIASLVIEAALYGIYVVCFCMSSWILYQKHHKGRASMRVFSMSAIMFLVGTAHFGINSFRLLSGFVLQNRDPITGDIILGTSNPSFVAKNALFWIQTLLGDGFLLYRLYVTWGGSKLVCFPFFICFLTCVGIAIGQLATFTTTHNPDIYHSMVFVLSTIFGATTLFFDTSCSILIGIRMWRIYQKMQEHGVSSSHLKRVIVIVIESGAIYSTCTAFMVGFFVARSALHKIFVEALCQIIGIVFCTIIIRVEYAVYIKEPSVVKWDTLPLTRPESSRTQECSEIQFARADHS